MSKRLKTQQHFWCLVPGVCTGWKKSTTWWLWGPASLGLLLLNRQKNSINSEVMEIAGQFSPRSLLPGDWQEGAHWGELLRLHRRARHPSLPVWGPHLSHQVSPGQGVGQAILRLCPIHTQVIFQSNSPAPKVSHSFTIRVLGQVNDTNGVPQTVPIPPNIDTVNALFGTSLDTEEDMVAWLDERRPKSEKPPANGEEMSISRVQVCSASVALTCFKLPI